MFQKKLLPGTFVGLSLTIALVSTNFLLDKVWNIPFLPFILFNWLVPLIPGPIITFGIDSMIDTMLFFRMDVSNSAKTAEQVLSIILYAGLGTIISTINWLFNPLESIKKRLAIYLGWTLMGLFVIFLIGLVFVRSEGVIGSVVVSLILFFWLLANWLAIKFGWKAVIVPTGDKQLKPEPREVAQISRRQFLITLGTSTAAVSVAGVGLGLLLDKNRKLDRSLIGGYVPSHELPNADDPVQPVTGTRWEYTPVEEHYQVFLELEPTEISPEGYSLPVTGLVSNPLNLTLDDMYNRFESYDQYVTLSCISGRVGTTLISTTRWTGISLQDIVSSVDVKPEAKYLYIESADGFHETIPLSLIDQDRRIMLCHSWDGQPLPAGHGFPCRIWIPDRFGMKQPKWIVKMVFTDTDKPGYWVERGWDKIAQVKTTSVIDTVAVDEIGLKNGERVVPVGGIAWAGDRQISRVEVRADGGDWETAALRRPLSETTWVIWRYDWPFEEGSHFLEVRCFEGDGTEQIAETASARPSGSTGIHSREIET